MYMDIGTFVPCPKTPLNRICKLLNRHIGIIFWSQNWGALMQNIPAPFECYQKIVNWLNKTRSGNELMKHKGR